jgi:serine/threonine protein kinase
VAANKRQDQDISGQDIAYGRYQLERLEASDSLGNLYLALDRHLATKVNVRIVHDHLAQDNQYASRFVNAARSAILHPHPNLIRVFDFGDVDNHLYVSMELLPRPSLAEILTEMHNTQRWVALDEALFVVQQIGQALAYLHRYGFYTRSVEPSQIMLRNEVATLPMGRFAYQPVLVDLPVDSPHRLLGDYGLAPAYAYMPPEVILRQGADERSDVYMLGALTWEIMVGQQTFKADNIAEAVDFHVNHRQVPVRAHHPTLPESLVTIVEKALAQSPEQRYPTISAMLEALLAIPVTTADGILPPGTFVAQLRPQQAPPPMPASKPAQVAAMGEPVSPIVASPPIVASQGTPQSTPSPQITPPEIAAPTIMELQVQNANQGKRLFPLSKAIFTIGRSPDNDVLLDDPRVSRRHAHIEFDGYNYYIADLKSSNGIMFGDMRIPPGEKLLWGPGTTIRIGESTLQLVPRQGAVAQSELTLPHTALPSLQTASSVQKIPTPVEEVGAALLLEREDYEVKPGQHLVIPLIVRNPKRNADVFVLSVEGLPTTWLSYPPAVRLEPHSQERLNLQVQPARSPQTFATTYPLQIKATSQQDPRQVAYAQINLTITLYGELHIELQPSTINEGETMRVKIVNQANGAQMINLMWWDDQHELIFHPKDAAVQLHAGETSFVEFSTSVQKTGWLAQTKSFAITVQAHPQVGELRLCKGTIIRRGRMPIR